jgi:flagellar motor switch protein FliM
VVRGFTDKILGLFREAWQDHIAFEPEVVGFESTPDMLQFASREDNVLVANLEVRANEFASMVTICLPLIALESFLGEKSGARTPVVPGRSATPAIRQSVELAVRGAVVDIAVRFPPVRLTAREVAGLRTGQIIQTTHATDDPIELHVNGSPRFLGALGQYRRMLGVRITQPVVAKAAGSVGRSSRGRISE